MRALITGYSGFVGPHLARHLLECSDEVWGVEFPAGFEAPAFIRDAVSAVRVRSCDLTTGADDIAVLIDEARPDTIYHLAALSHVPTAWSDPAAVYRVNVIGTLNLLEATKRHAPEAATLVVTSGDVYGRRESGETELTEASALRPVNPYAASKAAQDEISAILANAEARRIVRARPFNHTGPGQSVNFVCAAFARQVARVKLGYDEAVIRTGDLSTERDFLDVRDVVRAYRLAVTEGRPGDVFNIASGEARTIESILQRLLELADVDARVERDPSSARPTDSSPPHVNTDAIRAATGWAPQIPFDQTLRDLLDNFLSEERL